MRRLFRWRFMSLPRHLLRGRLVRKEGFSLPPSEGGGVVNMYDIVTVRNIMDIFEKLTSVFRAKDFRRLITN